MEICIADRMHNSIADLTYFNNAFGAKWLLHGVIMIIYNI